MACRLWFRRTMSAWVWLRGVGFAYGNGDVSGGEDGGVVDAVSYHEGGGF